MIPTYLTRQLIQLVLARAVQADPSEYLALLRSARRILMRLALVPAAGGLAAGVAAGVAVGLLVAPKPGRELRREIRARVRDLWRGRVRLRLVVTDGHEVR